MFMVESRRSRSSTLIASRLACSMSMMLFHVSDTIVHGDDQAHVRGMRHGLVVLTLGCGRREWEQAQKKTRRVERAQWRRDVEQKAPRSTKSAGL